MTPTPEQQVNALWEAIGSTKYVLDLGHKDGSRALFIFAYDNGKVNFAEPIAEFAAPTREEVIAKLIAYQAAERMS